MPMREVLAEFPQPTLRCKFRAPSAAFSNAAHKWDEANYPYRVDASPTP